MGLREAIGISNAAIYQELARRIGLETMQEYVSKLAYGNEDIGEAVDKFWLEGPLEISAIEQVMFLADLAAGTLPLSKDVQETVRGMILLEGGDGRLLFGKTGWQNAPVQGIGWWVGWIVQEGRVYSFALNIDIEQVSDAKKRVELGRASLQALGVL